MQGQVKAVLKLRDACRQGPACKLILRVSCNACTCVLWYRHEAFWQRCTESPKARVTSDEVKAGLTQFQAIPGPTFYLSDVHQAVCSAVAMSAHNRHDSHAFQIFHNSVSSHSARFFRCSVPELRHRLSRWMERASWHQLLACRQGF